MFNNQYTHLLVLILMKEIIVACSNNGIVHSIVENLAQRHYGIIMFLLMKVQPE